MMRLFTWQELRTGSNEVSGEAALPRVCPDEDEGDGDGAASTLARLLPAPAIMVRVMRRKKWWRGCQKLLKKKSCEGLAGGSSVRRRKPRTGPRSFKRAVAAGGPPVRQARSATKTS